MKVICWQFKIKQLEINMIEKVSCEISLMQNQKPKLISIRADNTYFRKPDSVVGYVGAPGF